MLGYTIDKAHREKALIADVAAEMVKEYRAEKKILNGYHHPQHIIDPRVDRLSELAGEYGIRGEHQKLAYAIQNESGKVFSRTLYLNAPGIIAAILSDMGLSPNQIKGVAILSRTVSLVAHSIEEKDREKSWRASTRAEITQPLDLSLQSPEFYDGPKKRKLIQK